MKDPLVRQSLICGLCLMLVNGFVLASGFYPALLISANLLPGFAYALLLVRHGSEERRIVQLLFVVLAGGLNYLAGWVAMGYSPLGNYSATIFAFGSLSGAVLLYCLVCVLIDRNLNIQQGILWVAAGGLLASLIPGMVNAAGLGKFSGGGWEAYFYSFGFCTIFPLWQTFFSLAVQKSRKETASTGTAEFASAA